jgi:molybdopterin molybdotransferase
MIRVANAQAVVREHTRPFPAREVSLSSALGLVLAEDVTSDLDMPPFDKALMDGFAVRSADLAAGQLVLTVIEEITAGQTPKRPLRERGDATRIMTGAPLPAGADAVIAVEQTRMLEGGRVRVDDRPPAPGKHVLLRGREMRAGETILPAGTALRPQEIGILAAVGRNAVRVHPAPMVSIVPTGDELVEANENPGAAQIRNSNGPMLAAQIARAGGHSHYLGIARDQLESLKSLIGLGLLSPVLVLSGGVSAGKLDLVPGVLQELGVQAHFHKVEMKPGKPVFFGTRSSSLVFGLPGNPVSSLVCFELFVRPAIRQLMGHADPGPHFVPLPLAEDWQYSCDRPTYHPARVDRGTAARVRPVPWFGSADLRALAQANALVLVEPGEHRFAAGESLPVLLLDE